MALESIFTRIKTELGLLLTSWSLSDAQKTDLILGALGYDFAQSSGIRFDSEMFDLNFREVDSELFRSITNATLDDTLTITDVAAGAAVLETNPISFMHTRPMLMYLTYDGDLSGGTFAYDLCLNAIKEDEDAGIFLSEERTTPVTQNWATDLYVDTYPADHLVIRLTLTTAGNIRAVRVRIVYGGSTVPQAAVGQIACLAAARFHRSRLETAHKERWTDDAKAGIRDIMVDYTNRAKGILATGKGQVMSGGGGIVEYPGYQNPFRKRMGM